MDLTELTERIEKISAGYADAFGIERDGDWFLLKLQEELGELTQAYLQHTGRARAKGRTPAEIRDALHEEFADVLCQFLLLADHLGVDLPYQISQKWLVREGGASGDSAVSPAAPAPGGRS